MVRSILLPQNDPRSQQQKEKHFKQMRDIYSYDLGSPYFSFDGSLAFLDYQTFPYQFSPKSIRLFALLMKNAGFNLVFSTIISALKVIPVLAYVLLKRMVKGYPFPEFKDYHSYFWTRPDLQFLNNFDSDLYFGVQRVLGPNPNWIEGLTDAHQLPEEFRSIVNFLIDQTYEEALGDGRLYITDYSVLQDLTSDPQRRGGSEQYTTAPLALFYRQEDGFLRPLAIQLYGTEPVSPTNPIYSPADGQHWTMAKLFVQTADITVQIFWTHVSFTHYQMNPILLASYRNLSPNHPLFILLKPHWQGTLYVNNITRFFRTAKTGEATFFGRIVPCEMGTLSSFIGKGLRKFNIKGDSFPNSLQKRHVEDPALFYPYRDDGKLVWDAISRFTREYCELYYLSDQDVLDDYELQAWGGEIGGSLEQGKMGVSGFPTEFKSVDEVADTVANVIFTATAQHSCVHYTLFDYAGFIPNMPPSLNILPSKFLGRQVLKEDLLQMMPAFDNMLIQGLGYAFNNFRTNRIGGYNLNQFGQEARGVIENFQEHLKEITKQVDLRNQTRPFPYIHMNPSSIPNSITG